MTYQDYIRACLLEGYNTLSANTTGEKILDFSEIEDGWHFGEGISISSKAIRDASRLYDVLIEYGFYETDAFPGLAGEVRVTAYWNDYYFEFTRERDGRWSFIEEIGGIEQEQAEQHSLTSSQAHKIVEEIAQSIWNTFATSPEFIGTPEKTDFRVWRSSLRQTEESPLSSRIAPYYSDPSANTFDFFIQNPVNPQFSGSFQGQFYPQMPQLYQRLLKPTPMTSVIERFSGFPIESQNVCLSPNVGRIVNQGMLKFAQGTVQDPSLVQMFHFDAQPVGHVQMAAPHPILNLPSFPADRSLLSEPR
jgi:hypothetical protein